MADEGILRFSNAEGVTALNRYHNFLTNYGDFGAMRRINWTNASGLGSASFTNIPQTFQDLILVVNGLDGATSGVSGYSIGINNDFTGLASSTTVEGNGTSAYSNRSSGDGGWGVTGFPGATGIAGSSVVHILNYTNTTSFKTGLSRYAADRNGSGVTGARVFLFRTTNAITRLDFFPYTGNFGTTTTFALYGVRASAA